ncbi:hypothetical protein [Sphingomonas sp. PP-CE-3A-406]|uniref:hypothetical protein n=1 Tax=Sphingomonas sp. PP-CE-3A-406 TaxID=2135659 RepID=UPI00160551B5|nr:hypothetical protein [Sphingomonas sp. PP-CE-3A-406]
MQDHPFFLIPVPGKRPGGHSTAHPKAGRMPRVLARYRSNRQYGRPMLAAIR